MDCISSAIELFVVVVASLLHGPLRVDLVHAERKINCTRVVLDTKSQNIPEVVVVRRGAGGVRGIGRGGSTG